MSERRQWSGERAECHALRARTWANTHRSSPDLRLVDYKVRILTSAFTGRAVTRVMVKLADGKGRALVHGGVSGELSSTRRSRRWPTFHHLQALSRRRARLALRRASARASGSPKRPRARPARSYTESRVRRRRAGQVYEVNENRRSAVAASLTCSRFPLTSADLKRCKPTSPPKAGLQCRVSSRSIGLSRCLSDR